MIFILIPVHNRVKYTTLLLNCLSLQKYKHKIVVIDDGSSDGTSDLIKKKYNHVVIIEGDGNLWWTGAINLGIHYVLKNCNPEDSILTINNDLFVEINYLSEMTKAMAANPNSLIGSVALNQADKDTIIDGGVSINKLTAKYKYFNKGHSYKSFQKPKYLNVDTLPGRGLLFPVSLIHEIGILNENLPQYAADYEFTMRAKKAGHKLLVNYKAPVYSHVEETGLNNEYIKMSWSNFFRSFSDIKSPYNLKYRWIFAKSVIPLHYLPAYFLFDALRAIIGGFRNQLRSI